MADDVYEACRNADGTVNWEKVEERLKALPATALSRGIPQVDLPRYSGDLDNLKPEFKAVLPSIGGLLSQLGYGDIAEYTSGYRDPERNAAAGGSPTSHHLNRDAVDIYIGSLSEEEQAEVEATFDPYFSEVLYHEVDNGGLHLHLGGYRGGLDDRADDTEVTASAYSPDRLKTIRTLLKNKDRDAKVLQKQKQEEYAAQIGMSVDTAATYSEKVDIVRKSNLPTATKKKLFLILKKKQRCWKTPRIWIRTSFTISPSIANKVIKNVPTTKIMLLTTIIWKIEHRQALKTQTTVKPRPS